MPTDGQMFAMFRAETLFFHVSLYIVVQDVELTD